MAELFNQLSVERSVQEIQTSRDICRTILDYGVSQRQLLYIIKFLAAELEDNDAMRDFGIIAKDCIEKLDNDDDTSLTKLMSEA